MFVKVDGTVYSFTNTTTADTCCTTLFTTAPNTATGDVSTNLFLTDNPAWTSKETYGIKHREGKSYRPRFFSFRISWYPFQLANFSCLTWIKFVLVERPTGIIISIPIDSTTFITCFTTSSTIAFITAAANISTYLFSIGDLAGT